MLRKFIIPTVIVSILLLLTNLTTITEATSVKTSTSTTITKTTTIPPSSTTTLILKTPPSPPLSSTVVLPSNLSTTVLHLTKARRATNLIVNRFLNNATAATETTTSLLPLQPPLNVTSTTLASFILNRKHQQQQRKIKRKQQQQLLLLQQQRRQEQHHRHRQVKDVEESQQIHEHLINDNNANGNKEMKKKDLDNSFFMVSSTPNIITPEPSSTHAYIPFDLDYNDPTEEKAAQPVNSQQSTINELLSKLFPKGFSDIFRFSYVGEPEITNTNLPPITVIKSTPTPFKPMPTTRTKKKDKPDMPKNATIVRVTKTVTRETRREVSPGHVEIVVEKIFTDPSIGKSNEDFKDGSNSINKEEILRINRAAKEASVLPSLLINPQSNYSSNNTNIQQDVPIVILNETNNNDDFVDAPEDDNQIAETQDVIHQVFQPPLAESTNFQATPNHQYSVHIIHDDTLNSNHNDELVHKEQKAVRNSPSYQSFVEQSKYIQNSLEEVPSRKFSKYFHHPILTQNPTPAPITTENSHYEKNSAQSHIQTVPSVAQLQYVHHQIQPQTQILQQKPEQTDENQQFYTQPLGKEQVSDMNFYHIDSDQQGVQISTPAKLIFVTISPPTATKNQPAKVEHSYIEETKVIPSQSIKSPHEFVTNAMDYHHYQPLADHQVQQTENNPKSTNAGYTFVEVQKSINIHNKLITEKDGRLIEQHETIYPEQKQVESHIAQQPASDYVSLSQNPIHVEQEEERYESAASTKDEQHALSPSQKAAEFDAIQQSNLIQETHFIEATQQLDDGPENYDHPDVNYRSLYPDKHEEEEKKEVEDHLIGEEYSAPVNIPYSPTVQIPYTLPTGEPATPPAAPMVVQEIIEKHIAVPYGVPQPVGIPVHIQHFIDRPYPVETIVEKPMPYPVEKIVEKVVEKHVPVEVEKIVEKPVEKVVRKYINRPVAIPIKIPVALHIPAPPHGVSPYGHASPHYPPTYGSDGSLDHASTWPQTVNGGSFARVPTSILKSYYVKMLKKLVPQMQQAYKNSALNKEVPKSNLKPYAKPNYKISDILYDLKPPPPRPKEGSSWDVGARYQYDYNTLPLDLSVSSSMAIGKQSERMARGLKINFDEFQRWRNGHSLKRSPDFGRNLHVEYGFKPPLVPSLEIDDKGMPLKAAADLVKGKEE